MPYPYKYISFKTVVLAVCATALAALYDPIWSVLWQIIRNPLLFGLLGPMHSLRFMYVITVLAVFFVFLFVCHTFECELRKLSAPSTSRQILRRQQALCLLPALVTVFFGVLVPVIWLSSGTVAFDATHPTVIAYGIFMLVNTCISALGMSQSWKIKKQIDAMDASPD